MEEEICPETSMKSHDKSHAGTSDIFHKQMGQAFSFLASFWSLTKIFYSTGEKKGDERVLMTADLKQKNKFHSGGALP